MVYLRSEVSYIKRCQIFNCNISTDENSSLRIESFAVINLYVVFPQTKLTFLICLLIKGQVIRATK